MPQSASLSRRLSGFFTDESLYRVLFFPEINTHLYIKSYSLYQHILSLYIYKHKNLFIFHFAHAIIIAVISLLLCIKIFFIYDLPDCMPVQSGFFCLPLVKLTIQLIYKYTAKQLKIT